MLFFSLGVANMNIRALNTLVKAKMCVHSQKIARKELLYSHHDCHELPLCKLRLGGRSRPNLAESFHKDRLHFTLVVSGNTELLHFRLGRLDGERHGYLHRRKEILVLAPSKVVQTTGVCQQEMIPLAMFG